MPDLTLILLFTALGLFGLNLLRAVWSMIRLIRLPASDVEPDPAAQAESNRLLTRFLRSFIYAFASFIAAGIVIWLGCDLDTLECTSGYGGDNRPFRWSFQN